MTQAQLLKRLETLEQEMQNLKARLAITPIERRKTYKDYIGMFHNDPDFERAVKAGAKYRNSLRPKAGKKKHAAKK